MIMTFKIFFVWLQLVSYQNKFQYSCGELIHHYSKPENMKYITIWADSIFKDNKKIELLKENSWRIWVNNFLVEEPYKKLDLDKSKIGFFPEVLRLYVGHFLDVPENEYGRDSVKYIELFEGREPGVRIKRKLTPEQEVRYQLDEQKFPKADYQIDDRISVYCSSHVH